MKKNLLLSSALFVIAASSFSQTKLTNNPAVNIVAGNSVTCSGGGIITTDNSFFHVYDLDDYTNITDTAFIVRMRVGAEETSGGAYNIVGAVHTLVGTPILANMTMISDDTAAIYPDSSSYLMNIIFDSGYILPGDSIASELKLPTNATASFYPASNTAAESSPTYIVAAGCAITELTTMATVGFPTMHLIMNLYVNQKPSMTDMTTSCLKNDSVYFSDADFTANFVDNDNDGLTMMKIVDLPSNGILDLNGTTLVLGDTVYTSELNTLYYIPNLSYAGSDFFTVRACDTTHWSNTTTQVDITVIDWQVGLTETENSAIRIYPNPASNAVTISVDEKIMNVRIYNAEGRLVLTRNSADTTVDISKFENGNYFMEVTTETGILKKQFVKQ